MLIAKYHINYSEAAMILVLTVQ